MDNSTFVGVDLHKTQFTVCLLRNGTVLEDGIQYPMEEKGYDSFLEALRKAQQPVSIAIESTANSRFFKERMEQHGYSVTVVNTLRFKVVNLSTKKTDKNDARTLAVFLSKNMLPQSHLCSPESEALRRILKSRALLVQNSVALKNQAHAMLLAYGYVTQTAQFQSQKGRESLLSTLPSDHSRVIDPLFDTLCVLEAQRKKLERNLKSITTQDRTVNLLMTIPGVGVINACTIRAYIDDINRFPNYKNFSAYCGLVPWVQTSNETVRYGRITKRGPQELRTALVQCVVSMVRMENKTKGLSIMKQYHELKNQKSSGKAIIATARKLSRIIYIMLTTNTPFNVNRLTEKQ